MRQEFYLQHRSLDFLHGFWSSVNSLHTGQWWLVLCLAWVPAQNHSEFRIIFPTTTSSINHIVMSPLMSDCAAAQWTSTHHEGYFMDSGCTLQGAAIPPHPQRVHRQQLHPNGFRSKDSRSSKVQRLPTSERYPCHIEMYRFPFAIKICATGSLLKLRYSVGFVFPLKRCVQVHLCYWGDPLFRKIKKRYWYFKEFSKIFCMWHFCFMMLHVTHSPIK